MTGTKPLQVHPVDAMSEGYGRLYDYAADHAESAEIFQAID